MVAPIEPAEEKIGDASSQPLPDPDVVDEISETIPDYPPVYEMVIEWDLAIKDDCATPQFYLCNLLGDRPQMGDYLAVYELAKQYEDEIVSKISEWGSYGVYGGFCEGSGHTGSCRNDVEDPEERLTGDAICVRCA